MSFRILFQDPHLVAIDKPAGFHVHPPEDPSHRISNQVNCLYLLSRQLGQYLYPVHRLDRATSGVLLFALQPEAARILGESFKNHQIRKTYFAVTRGWVKERGTIDHPLKTLKTAEASQLLPSITDFFLTAKTELPFPVGRYSSARYSLVEIYPKSGRRHQIRRHFDHLAHPLIGDTIYGEGAHNRFFKEHLKISGLLLKAYQLEFNHPITHDPLTVQSRWDGRWHQVFDLFGSCPVPKPAPKPAPKNEAL